jgi:hypothetical protein
MLLNEELATAPIAQGGERQCLERTRRDENERFT